MNQSETEEQKKQRILAVLKQKMLEIKKLREEIKEDDFFDGASPTEAKELIEEINVPSLRVLKDKKNKKNSDV